jgi:hypothetical protein
MSGIFLFLFISSKWQERRAANTVKKIVNLIDTIVLEATYIMYKI